MEEAASTLLGGAGLVLLAVGLGGAVIPVLPGPFLIWLGALLWAWADGFERVGWPTLIVLAVLAAVAWGSDLFLNLVIGRKAGASWKAILGAIVGGILGGLLLSGLFPFLGTILGALVGAVAGAYVVELREKRDAAAARAAVRAYLASMAVSAVVEMGIAVGMVGLFVWQAFL